MIKTKEQKEAKRLYLKQWHEDHPEYSKQYRLDHKAEIKQYLLDHRAERNECIKQWYAANPDKVRNILLKHRYGIDIAAYNDMFIQQDGCCGICGTHVSKLNGGLVCDHDHETGRFRGLLCTACNVKLGASGLGKFKETDDLYCKAIDYLNRQISVEQLKAV